MLKNNSNYNIKIKEKNFQPRKTKKLVANTKFDAKLAQRLVDSSYYRAQGINMREYVKLERAKILLSTIPWDKVSILIEQYKHLAQTEVSGILKGRTFIGLYEKNKHFVLCRN